MHIYKLRGIFEYDETIFLICIRIYRRPPGINLINKDFLMVLRGL